VDLGVLFLGEEGLLVDAQETDLCVASDVTQARVTEALKVGAETYEGELELELYGVASEHLDRDRPPASWPLGSPPVAGRIRQALSPDFFSTTPCAARPAPTSKISRWVAPRPLRNFPRGVSGTRSAPRPHGTHAGVQVVRSGAAIPLPAARGANSSAPYVAATTKGR
jgi:hypothetical protein